MSSPASPPFYTRYGFTRTGDRDAPLAVAPYPEICHHGALRATVVASAIDLVGGFFTRETAGADATFTSDLSLRIPSPGIPETLLAHGTPLRSGRRLVTTGVRLQVGGTTYAYGETTFSRIVREGESRPDVASLATPASLERHPLDQPLADEVGVEILDAATGALRLELRPALLNPEGVMQGALVALVTECAALSLADHAMSRPQVVSELDLRYLSAAATGPVEAQASWIGSSETRMLRVALRDRGRADRLTTTALIRVTDAPSPN